MLGKYSYIFTDIFFTVPLLILMWTRGRNVIKQHIKTLILSTLFFTFYFLLVDPPAVRWGAWGYDTSKTFNIWIAGALLEELIFSILVSLTLSSVTILVAHLEDQGLNLKNIINRIIHNLMQSNQ